MLLSRHRYNFHRLKPEGLEILRAVDCDSPQPSLDAILLFFSYSDMLFLDRLCQIFECRKEKKERNIVFTYFKSV